jgi:hypothetical protein
MRSRADCGAQIAVGSGECGAEFGDLFCLLMDALVGKFEASLEWGVGGSGCCRAVDGSGAGAALESRHAGTSTSTSVQGVIRRAEPV